MDIKEIGAGAVVVIGGVAYTMSQGGLADALTEDVKHISDISYEDRSAYMTTIVDDFSENFSNYIIQSETFDFVGYSSFSASPQQGSFIEVVKSKETADNTQLRATKAKIEETDFCEQEEMTMLTDKGWSYHFSLENADGRNFYSVTCTGGVPNLRLSS